MCLSCANKRQTCNFVDQVSENNKKFWIWKCRPKNNMWGLNPKRTFCRGIFYQLTLIIIIIIRKVLSYNVENGRKNLDFYLRFEKNVILKDSLLKKINKLKKKQWFQWSDNQIGTLFFIKVAFVMMNLKSIDFYYCFIVNNETMDQILKQYLMSCVNRLHAQDVKL